MPALERDAASGVDRLARLAMYSVSVALEPLSGASPCARATALSRIASRVLAEFGLVIESSGPLPSGPCVLVSNHLSWFDPLVVATRVPVTAIAKSEVAAWPFVGARARDLGVIFVDRSSAHSGVGSLLKARRALEQGLCVLNFPEGTTTRGDTVLPFRRAIFGLARLMRVPVVPIRLEVDPALTWVGDDPLLPHLWRVASSQRPVVRLRFEAPFLAGEEPDTALAERVRQRIACRGITQEAPNHAALCA